MSVLSVFCVSSFAKFADEMYRKARCVIVPPNTQTRDLFLPCEWCPNEVRSRGRVDNVHIGSSAYRVLSALSVSSCKEDRKSSFDLNLRT